MILYSGRYFFGVLIHNLRYPWIFLEGFQKVKIWLVLSIRIIKEESSLSLEKFLNSNLNLNKVNKVEVNKNTLKNASFTYINHDINYET